MINRHSVLTKAKGGRRMKLQHVLVGVVAVAAWVAWAQHPTARNLRTAIADTLPLL